MKSPARDQEFKSHTAYLRDFPMQAGEHVQYGRGDFDLRATTVWGSRCFFTHVSSTPKSAWFGVPDCHWIGFIIPLTWTGDFKVCGMDARANDVFLLSDADGYHTVGQGRNNILFAVHIFALLEAWKTETGHDIAPATVPRITLRLEEGAAVQIRRHVGHMLRSRPFLRTLDGRLVLFPIAETAMIHIIGQALIHLTEKDIRLSPRIMSQNQFAKRVEAYLRREDPSMMSVPGMMASIGVGRSRFFERFVDTYGLPPAQFLRKFRLTAVREHLLAEQHPPRSVKDVAIKYGFTASGRFATDYRQVFGEAPSETLLRR